ncbi:acyltransferase [Bacteroidales bacterium]|nr:acyltransferase [Bacteroidales bacterium]
MIKNSKFDDIRPYYDDEVVGAIKRLMGDSEFQRVVKFLDPEIDWEGFKKLMYSFTNKFDFQHSIIKDTVSKIAEKTSHSSNIGGLDNVSKDGAYTYISNHRDIILDASLLCTFLSKSGYDTTEIAIGDNLLLQPWIEDIVRLNKSFIVKRGVSARQMLEVSKHLSEYIHHTIQNKKQSVWIAQRQGRAKNSDDKTQESLLKMLSMGDDKKFLASIQALNIAPLSLSYEYDPSDYLKAQEFQEKRDNPEFKKSANDDLINMETGITGYKGNIHFQVGKPINPILEELDASIPKSELVAVLAKIIDKEIYLNYKFYPINYIAYQKLFGSAIFADKYTKEEEEMVDSYFKTQLDKITLPQKDLPFLEQKLMEMYAFPVINYIEAKK